MEAVFDPASGLYRSGSLGVSKALSEDLIAIAYLRLKAENQLSTLYYEGTPLLSWHLRLMSAPETILLGAYADRSRDGRGVEFCGLGWVMRSEELGNGMKKSEVGFAFFRHVASPSEKIALGRMMLEVLFGNFQKDILFGIVPSCNRAALAYAKAVGFSVHGPIPNLVSWEGALESIMMPVLTKAEWLANQRLDLDVEHAELREVA